jgi:Arc/MetJ-type ribon-helix-helix transcriptional regulator
MATLHISLSDALKDFVQHQVELRGFSNASDYVRTLIREALEKQKLSETEKVLQKMAQLQAAYPALATAAGRDAFFDDMIKESAGTTVQQEDNIMQTAIAEINAQRQGK